ncbi:MAG: amidohydrolase [Candidatus Marinimicrobia bacterium]|jgi:amidohydrolase|nr:amidohydrolase [Candidatus Neomarinimicrobiota bacterium]MBT3617631.1 amidohydrolase [Candidatus Neomarinimicrobiota bacterium]MBT3829095.1 amidohydrolase [Candidatus Neomarinimicrobiota bacterium]MBT3997723.1 amidohydrolase [Candidatus Neomarinimicrobiota bacterium]MBT4281390.1 amidohydrolase [Candidatus Neomarinimicrobiota bacterium]
MKINILNKIELIKNEIITTRRDIHKHPELGFQEIRTAGLVAKRLQSLGMDVKTGVGKTGVVGDLKGKGEGPTIALRADMDALPIQETGEKEYISVNDGVMHACGHDGHVAMLLGAAKVLAEKRDELNGNVRFIFQPAEEGEGGARYMIEDGCLEDVDEIYGIHLWTYQNTGEIGIKPGPILAYADKFTITVKGIGGHGAAPHGSVDAVLVASHLVIALQTIVSRNTDPLKSSVVSIGKINGGYNFNVIADEIVLLGTARAYEEDIQAMIKKRMGDIIDGVAQTFGAKIKFDYQEGYPATINDEVAYEKLLSSAKKIVGEGADFPYLSMGGEDFSYYAQKVPGCFFFVGAAPKNQPFQSVPHHCSHFDIDEEALLVGASVFVQVVEDLIGKNSQ